MGFAGWGSTVLSVSAVLSFAGVVSAASLSAKAKEEGCTGKPTVVEGTGLYRCPTQNGVHYFHFGTIESNADSIQVDPIEARFDAAFAKVRIGMTKDQVDRIDQVGNHCTAWPKQRPPTCGPLRYYQDVSTVETAAGVTRTVSWGRRQIVFKNGVVVVIVR